MTQIPTKRVEVEVPKDEPRPELKEVFRKPPEQIMEQVVKTVQEWKDLKKAKKELDSKIGTAEDDVLRMLLHLDKLGADAAPAMQALQRQQGKTGGFNVIVDDIQPVVYKEDAVVGNPRTNEAKENLEAILKDLEQKGVKRDTFLTTPEPAVDKEKLLDTLANPGEELREKLKDARQQYLDANRLTEVQKIRFDPAPKRPRKGGAENGKQA